MAYTIEPNEEKRYLYVTVHGAMNHSDMTRLRKDLVQAMAETGLLGVLADAYPLGVRIAVLVKPDYDRDLAFVETVAANRGVQFRFFRDEEAAMVFLTSGREDN